MLESEKKYLFIVLIHAFIGVAMFYVPFFPKIYGYSIIFGGIYFAVKNSNQNNEVLYAAAYMVGSEILLRMTDGNPIYEFSKYGVIMLVLIGIYYSGISKNALPYWLFLILLIPGVIEATYSTDYYGSLRKMISFNISGPLCLGISALYTYNRKVTFSQLGEILLAAGLPIISVMVYLSLYTPNIKDIITGTGSNVEASGGFGPNQVSTILGLGMFIFVSRLIFNSRSKVLLLINLIIVFNISFRGLMTFSRGGMLTGGMMIVVLILITYVKINNSGRMKMNAMIAFVSIAMVAIWLYSLDQTGGLIQKRYSNQDAAGRVKESQFTGREGIFNDQMIDFLGNPVFGVGVGINTENRIKRTGLELLSHNEIGRMLAEHGALGVMGLLILALTPLILYLDNKDNFFIVCFVIFWLLTINHAAMRLAVPAYIYSLSLLKISLNEEKHPVHRE